MKLTMQLYNKIREHNLVLFRLCPTPSNTSYLTLLRSGVLIDKGLGGGPLQTRITLTFSEFVCPLFAYMIYRPKMVYGYR